MNWSSDIMIVILPLLYFAAGLCIGFLIEKIILFKILEAAKRTKWKGDDVIIKSFKGIIISLSIIISCYFCIHQLAFAETLTRTADKIIFSMVVLTVSVLVGRMLVGIIKSKTTSSARGALASSSIISNVTRVLVFMLGILVILQTLGISVTPVLTALGVGGLAVALALQDTLSNLFSGIQVIASQQIRTGDYVKLDTGEEGYISDITWRNTTIRALSNDLIIVPNAKIASAIVRNYQLPDKEIAVLVEVGVSYNSDLERVEEVTIQTAKQILENTEGGVKNFEPFIRYHSFGESGIKFTTILRGEDFVSQYLIKHEFIKALHIQYRKNAIEIPFPTRSVLIKSPLTIS
jgi:small-conductance mechanosensitive channel